MNKNLQEWKGFFYVLGLVFSSLLSALIAYILTEKIRIDISEFSVYLECIMLILGVILVWLLILFLNIINNINEKETSKKIKNVIEYIFNFSLSLFSAGIWLSIYKYFFEHKKWTYYDWFLNSFFLGIAISYSVLFITLVLSIIIMHKFYKKNKK